MARFEIKLREDAYVFIRYGIQPAARMWRNCAPVGYNIPWQKQSVRGKDLALLVAPVVDTTQRGHRHAYLMGYRTDIFTRSNVKTLLVVCKFYDFTAVECI